MDRVPMSVLAGVVQTHLDLLKLIPSHMLGKPSILSKAIDALSPMQQADLARALLRLRVCGQYLVELSLSVDTQCTDCIKPEVR